MKKHLIRAAATLICLLAILTIPADCKANPAINGNALVEYLNEEDGQSMRHESAAPAVIRNQAVYVQEDEQWEGYALTWFTVNHEAMDNRFSVHDVLEGIWMRRTDIDGNLVPAANTHWGFSDSRFHDYARPQYPHLDRSKDKFDNPCFKANGIWPIDSVGIWSRYPISACCTNYWSRGISSHAYEIWSHVRFFTGFDHRSTNGIPTEIKLRARPWPGVTAGHQRAGTFFLEYAGFENEDGDEIVIDVETGQIIVPGMPPDLVREEVACNPVGGIGRCIFPQCRVIIEIETDQAGTITVTRSTTTAEDLPPGLSAAGIYLNIEPDNNLAGNPAILIINYNLPLPGNIDERSLRVYRWSGNTWDLMPNQFIDVANRRIIVFVDEFSTFGVFDYPQSSDPGTGPGGSATALYDPVESTFYFLQSATLRYGPKNQGWLPLAGRWSKHNKDLVGLYDPADGIFHLQDKKPLRYGPRKSAWLPLTGDWNGDGFDNIGLYDPTDGVFHLAGIKPFRYGPRSSQWLPLSGDWNGDGISTIGLYDPQDGVFHLAGLKPFRYGPRNSDWLPLAGQWNSKNTSSIGLYEPKRGIYHLPGVDPFRFGPRHSNWLPLTGHR